MSDENKFITNEDPKPEANPERAPEVAPATSEPEIIPQSTPEVTPQNIPEVPKEAKPEVNPTIAQPEMPAVSTPQPAYTPQAQSQPYAPHYQAPKAQSQPYTQYYQAPQGQAQPYNPPYGTQQYVSYAPQPPKPQKKSKGAKVMLICLWVLLGFFSLVTIGSISYFMGKTDGSGLNKYPDIENPFIDFLKPTEPEEDETIPSATEALDDSDLYGEGEIVLNKYPADKNDSEKYNNQTAFAKVSPSAVGVVCYTDKDKKSVIGEGTGIIVNTDGYIATNSHVIGDSKSAYIIEVVLNDGTAYEAKVVGFDTRTDLAVVKIEAEGLIPAEFADSDLASIGEDVIAVGNPGGMEFQNTLTRGVISAKDRTLGLSTQVKYIQTDAAINPGNSGGPLCNLCGQVIGVNSAKIASEDYEGMGFAIPSRTVKEVVDDLIKQGFVSGRVKIGIMGTAVTASESIYNNVPQGILVSEVIEGGPCDNGKILAGDIVVAIDETEITSFNDIYTALMNYNEGDKATLKVYRPDTKNYVEVEIVLQADK